MSKRSDRNKLENLQQFSKAGLIPPEPSVSVDLDAAVAVLFGC